MTRDMCTKRNYLLDAFRLFAALGIVTLYCEFYLGNFHWWQMIRPLMDCGVPFFFLISGYFVRSNEKCKVQIIKVLKLILISIVVYTPISLYKHSHFLSSILDFSNLINIIIFNATPWEGVMWFLSAMVYVLFLNIICFSKFSYRILVVVTCLSFLGYFIANSVDVTFNTTWMKAVPFFLFGKLLQRLSSLHSLILALMTLISGFGFYLNSLFNDTISCSNSFMISSFLSVSLFITLTMNEINRIGEDKIVFYLGRVGKEISLDVYLYHKLALFIGPAVFNRFSLEYIFKMNPVIWTLFLQS